MVSKHALGKRGADTLGFGLMSGLRHRFRHLDFVPHTEILPAGPHLIC